MLNSYSPGSEKTPRYTYYLFLNDMTPLLRALSDWHLTSILFNQGASIVVRKHRLNPYFVICTLLCVSLCTCFPNMYQKLWLCFFQRFYQPSTLQQRATWLF